MIQPQVNNIKASFRLVAEDLENKVRCFSLAEETVTKRSKNFFVVRARFVYVIFYGGHVNATKLKRVKDVESAQAELASLLSHYVFFRDVTIQDAKIDNISCSGNVPVRRGRGINLMQLAHHLRTYGLIFKYAPAKFPGLSFRVAKRITAVVFSSGKFVLVGIQSFRDIKCANLELIRHVILFKSSLRA